MNSSDLVAVVAPAVTALAGVIGVALHDWRQRRSVAGRRRAALDDALQQITVTNAWWNARQAIAPDPGAAVIASQWLAQAHDTITATPALFTNPARPLVRRLLLAYPFATRGAKALRIVFYLLIATMTFLALIAAGNVLAGEAVDTSRDALAWQFIWSIIFILITLTIGTLASALDKKAPHRQPLRASQQRTD
jgi:hypothetical protein